jgi:RNA polymerase nonessential primary-like sigma factor
MSVTIEYDPIRDLLRGIGRDELLTADQEIALSEQVQILRDIEALQATQPDLTEQELASQLGLTLPEFEKQTAVARRAKQAMVQHNLRLVVSIAKRYQGHGFPLEELISEGTIGLIRGVEKFDHTRGYKLSTYVTWWIRQGITRALSEKSRVIRVPIHVIEKQNKIRKAVREFAEKTGRRPTEAQLSELTGLSKERLLDAVSCKRTLSLDYKIGGEDTAFGDIVASTSGGIEAVEQRHTTEKVQELLNCLNPRQRLVISLRYGLDPARPPMTLEQVGDELGVGREQVRQIQVRAMKTLRRYARRSDLHSLIGAE